MDASSAAPFEVLSYGLLQQKVKRGVEGDPVSREFGLTSGDIATSNLRDIVAEANGGTVHDC